ncbi:PX-associated-domain-containing protein [Lasiosphaeria miniovina]|uniref:PX-associated-domain-containing protein n=1 Tax=Lasiosphaeria miniovina TaxID=1954250 RepID=A0AA40DQ34_9PEZI|nr:PX-associated-domain-containing protein [Lasiosphaeria miniovina]KAK0709281.1 PX-associated-domain-containing protein [Lasiosphaeria miniovina]
MAQVVVPDRTSSCASTSRRPAPVAPGTLTSSQLHALLDILTHYEVYAEVELFKDPATISSYGYPFKCDAANGAPEFAADSSAPLLATLLQNVLLPAPGIRDLPLEFWHVRLQGLMVTLAEADLSESYDKGALGSRKTLATAASVIHESLSRGMLGGVPSGPKRNLSGSYDRSRAEDLERAWEDGVHELVHGDLIDELFNCATEQSSLEEHSPAIRATVDYVIIHLATFLHYVFVLSPEGPYLVKLVENVHRLIPYTMIRQTLRVGNAASMLNGMVKLLLAKMGVGAISNWLGLTQNADDGMNLLQRIISLVLLWDTSEFRKTTDKIEKAKGGPPKEHLAAIKQYIDKSRIEHDRTRESSSNSSSSVIAKILEESDPKLLASLSKTQHAQCLEYFSASLEIRDREEITKALCRRNPDLFTQAIKDAVGSFEPMIRALHERIDLREQITAAEEFLTGFISASKPKKSASGISESVVEGAKTAGAETRAPAVEDYVNFLWKNKHTLYSWLHQIASKCPEVRDQFHAWANKTIKIFRQSKRATPVPANSSSPSEPATDQATVVDDSNAPFNRNQHSGAAGALSSNLQSLFAVLPSETRANVLAAVDAHAAYLSCLEDVSRKRMQQILDNIDITGDPAKGSPARGSPGPRGFSMCGPGIFLSRWQNLLDETVISPGVPKGPLRCGKDVKGSIIQARTVGAPAKGSWDPAALAELGEKEIPSQPNVDIAVSVLGSPFRDLLADLLKNQTETDGVVGQ